MNPRKTQPGTCGQGIEMEEKVESLQRLMQLSQEKRAVHCPSRNWGPVPCAFVVGMAGKTIAGFIDAGLYVYEKTGDKNE
jgi:hypothetical protein